MAELPQMRAPALSNPQFGTNGTIHNSNTSLLLHQSYLTKSALFNTYYDLKMLLVLNIWDQSDNNITKLEVKHLFD